MVMRNEIFQLRNRDGHERGRSRQPIFFAIAKCSPMAAVASVLARDARDLGNAIGQF